MKNSLRITVKGIIKVSFLQTALPLLTLVQTSLTCGTKLSLLSTNIPRPTPPEVIAARNVHPTLVTVPAQADVLALQNHSNIHNKTYSSEWSQAQVVDGTTREPVVMMRDISVDALLIPPDDVLDEAFDAELENSCALEDIYDLERRAMLIISHLMTDSDDFVKLARKLSVKDDILIRGYPKKPRSEPRTTVAIDVEETDEI